MLTSDIHIDTLIDEAISLLKKLIATPSVSKKEHLTAKLLSSYIADKGIKAHRLENNVWAYSNNYDREDLPVILLNSHHDTVKPAAGYTNDPHDAFEQDEKLYGLGSNDAGGALVALMATFIYYHDKELPYRLVYLASAEEEISGKNGVSLALPELGKIDVGVIGEPTKMQMAIAEKGLMVLDCIAHGKAGHAARNEGENAIYKAIEDMNWFNQYSFDKVSNLLGEVKMTVTQVNAGSQHNVVPDQCTFVVDVRTNECYTNEEVAQIISEHVSCEVKPRSFRLNSSGIPSDHPIVKKGVELGMTTYGSPTLSDQALMSFATLKIGPGDSARSHMADEYIFVDEIKEGIRTYIKLLSDITLNP